MLLRQRSPKARYSGFFIINLPSRVTQVDIRKIKTSKEGVEPLEVGFAEACKYGVKPWSTGSRISVNKLLSKKCVPRNLKGHTWLRETLEETAEVVDELMAALENRRLVQYGGILRDINEKTGCKCDVCGGDMFEHSYVWHSVLAHYLG